MDRRAAKGLLCLLSMLDRTLSFVHCLMCCFKRGDTTRHLPDCIVHVVCSLWQQSRAGMGYLTVIATGAHTHRSNISWCDACYHCCAVLTCSAQSDYESTKEVQRGIWNWEPRQGRTIITHGTPNAARRQHHRVSLTAYAMLVRVEHSGAEQL